jgi:hypothetical protein
MNSGRIEQNTPPVGADNTSTIPKKHASSTIVALFFNNTNKLLLS